MKPLDLSKLNTALQLLNEQLTLRDSPAVEIVVLGLPGGFRQRLITVVVGGKLTVHYIGRQDQIYFKTYASADRGGYHVADLRALNPTADELIAAAKWCMTQDVSEEFRIILREMFNQLGWPDVSNNI